MNRTVYWIKTLLPFNMGEMSAEQVEGMLTFFAILLLNPYALAIWVNLICFLCTGKSFCKWSGEKGM